MSARDVFAIYLLLSIYLHIYNGGGGVHATVKMGSDLCQHTQFLGCGPAGLARQHPSVSHGKLLAVPATLLLPKVTPSALTRRTGITYPLSPRVAESHTHAYIVS